MREFLTDAAPFLLVLSTVLLLFCVYFLLRIVRPHRRLTLALRRYNETRELSELRREDFADWPEVQRFIDSLADEMAFGTVTELKKQYAEYLALQNQINPHFLFNVLEDIRGDALEAGMRGLAQTTGALAAYFRYTITEPENLVRLEDELDNVENYYTIQRYRFGDRFRMSIEYPDEHLGYPDVRLPKLTLQPIAENAISHGLEGLTENGELKIEIETTQRDLVIHVRDNGVGMKQEMVESMNESFRQNQRQLVEDPPEKKEGRRHNGIALFNVNSRIRLLFGENYGLHILSIEGVGTDVEVRLPLVPDEESNRQNARPQENLRDSGAAYVQAAEESAETSYAQADDQNDYQGRE